MGAAEGDSSLAGRDDELAAVDGRLNEAAEGRGSLVVLSGEPGAGKTRVLQSALRTGRMRKFAVVSAANFEHARTPFGPLVEVLQALAPQIPDLVPKNAADRAAYERFVGLTQAGPDAPPPDKRRMFVIIAEGLQRAATRAPLVIGFDDAQWFDPETVELLHFLAPRLASLRAVVIITVRPETASEAIAVPLRALETYPSAVTIPIGPLSALTVREMILAATPGTRKLNGAVVDEICRRSDGNPLFVTELVRQALENRTGSLLPPTIQVAVAARLHVLTPGDRRIIEVASVFGRSFRLSDVMAVGETTRAPVVAALRAARDAGVVEEHSRDAETFDFRHELFCAAVYETLLGAERAELHRRIAIWLEAGAAAEALPHALLAYHWARAGDDAGVARFAEKAGDQALELNAAASAIDRFEEALESGAVDEASRARIEAKLAEAFNQLGEVANASAYAASSARYYRETGDVAEAARLDLEVAKFAYRGGNADETIAVCRRILDSAVTGRTRFGANARAAMCFAYRNDLGSAKAYIDAADAHDGERDVRDAVCLEYARAMTAMYAHDDDAWLDAARRALALAEESGDPGVLAPTLLNFAGMAAERGRDEVVAGALDRAIEIADANGRTYHSAYARCSRALAFRNAGRLADAYRTVREVSALYVDAAVVRIYAATAAVATLADTDRLGTLPKFEDREILEEAFATGESGRFAPLAAAHVLAAIVGGDPIAASAIIERTVPLIDVPTYTGEALCTFAQFGSRDVVAAIARVFEQAPVSGPARLHHMFVEACLARALGDSTGAHRRAILCADAALRAGAPLLRAAAYEVAGEVKNALEIYHAIEAHGHVRRLSGRSTDLSAREIEVCALVREGMSNRAIAERLVLSERTVEHHVASIYAKTGVRTRSELIASGVGGARRSSAR